jgi:hypothetical protein
MIGTIGGMASSMVISRPMDPSADQARCAREVDGTPVRLADGKVWLLASPTYCPSNQSLTKPGIDLPLDRLFDSIASEGKCCLEDIWEIARILLNTNYGIPDAHVCDLLGVSNSAEGSALASAVLEAIFGPEERSRTYTDWVRASLIANGLSASEISTRDLPNVLAILVATNRTVHVGRFTDACRAMNEQRTLDALV